MKIKFINKLFKLNISDEKLKQLDVILDIYFALQDIKSRLNEFDEFPIQIDNQLDALIKSIENRIGVI